VKILNKKLFFSVGMLVVLALLAVSLVGCSCGEKRNVTVNLTSQAADGLNLKALIPLVKKVKTGKELEKELNKPGGINNLDLNNDKKVDYIKVQEYGNKNKGAWGFSLTTEPVKGEVQEIGSIEMAKDEQNPQKANISVTGNEQIYGRNYHYNSTAALTSLMLWSYFMRPTWRPYYSPYYYGYYPSYYRPYPIVSRSAYTTRTSTITRNSNATRSRVSATSKAGINNPNKGKVASKGIKRGLRNPTRSQRSFQKRAASRSRRSGGFGRSTRGRSRGRRSFGGFGK
jgi:hypothetical protein